MLSKPAEQKQKWRWNNWYYSYLSAKNSQKTLGQSKAKILKIRCFVWTSNILFHQAICLIGICCSLKRHFLYRGCWMPCRPFACLHLHSSKRSRADRCHTFQCPCFLCSRILFSLVFPCIGGHLERTSSQLYHHRYNGLFWCRCLLNIRHSMRTSGFRSLLR